MKRKNKRYSVAVSAGVAALLLLFLLIGGLFFNRYLQQQIFIERTTQLNEITSQVQVNLDRALSVHWNYLNAAVRLLDGKSFQTEEDVAASISELEQLLGTDGYHSRLILLGSRGNCFDSGGRRGIWSNIDQLFKGEGRYSFLSDSLIYEGSHWAFVQALDTPLQLEEGNVSFIYVILLKDIEAIDRYYNSAAYGNQNETYILKSNGTRIRDDDGQQNSIQAYNVLKALEEMENQSIPDLRAALEESDTITANFTRDGTEYYYCITSVPDYDTLLLFLIPADCVASGTVNMVEAVVRTMLILTVILLVLMVLAVAAIALQQSSARLFRQEQENLRRQEEMNARLEETNVMLAESKQTAEQAFQIAEEANRAKSTFLSNMSHDIRTPMNAIVGFATLLARDAEKPDKVREYTRKITASGQHLLGLINDILDISKIEAGKTTLTLSDENMTDLIGNIDAIIRPQMKTKGHRFEVYNRDLKHEYVVMDKLRLNQILLNLLSNAVKYTPAGGHITLTIQELPQHSKQLAHYRFTVEDNGFGMSPEYVKTIFRAFTREEDSVTNKIQGTGLGMAITKNLVDLMGGSIKVESEKGKGSTFTVDLDLQISARAMDQSFWKNNGITRLLAVDDEEDVVKNIRLTMEGTGVSVDCALNGQAAVNLAVRAAQEGRPYDIVLIDWKMPGMDGVEAARRIRRDCPKGTPLLVLTSYDWTEIEDAAREAGVDAFLAKPFFLTSFRQKVDAALNRSPEPESGDDMEESILKGMHILVAEDNEINAEILSELLDMAGATCDICENGQAAVEEFASSAPDRYRLILMDVQMPVMNGYEAAKAIRALDHPLGQTIPIIAMTANAFAEDIRDALDAGMDAHVAKPVDMAVLEQAVRTVLEENSV